MGDTSPVDGTDPHSGLSWTGEVTGHGVVTLYGDADSVQKQIFALNPSLAENYTPNTKFISKTPPAYNASEVFTAPGSSAYYYKTLAGDANAVAVRDDVNGAKKLSDGFAPIDWYCATFATGDCKSNPTRQCSSSLFESPLPAVSHTPSHSLALVLFIIPWTPLLILENLTQIPRHTTLYPGSVLPLGRTPRTPCGPLQLGRTGHPPASVSRAPWSMATPAALPSMLVKPAPQVPSLLSMCPQKLTTCYWHNLSPFFLVVGGFRLTYDTVVQRQQVFGHDRGQ